MMVSRENHRGLIQSTQIFLNNGIVTDAAIEFGIGILVRIVRINAIGFVLGKQNGICTHLERTLYAGIISREKGIANTPGKNDNIPLIEMPRSNQANKGFCNCVNRNRGHHAHLGIAFGIEHAAQHQAVDNRAQHTDIIGLGAFNTPPITLLTPKNIAPANHNADFNTSVVNIENLIGNMFEGLRVKSRFQST